MSKHLTETKAFESEEIKRDTIKQVLRLTNTALEERGYNAVNQLAGYLISNDPAYISSHNNARSVIQSVDRADIIEELVRFYLENKCEEE
ncbi:MAG: IreB family regulatory phosphoprotein [Erysipelothrix sp.]|nr:IreB family regulatory phosphoprotein [Erysipelothrix sp.]